MLDADFTHTALYDELQQRLGIVIDRATERILPVLPDELDRVRLEVAADQPCFAIERLGLCHDHPIEWRHTLIRGDRFAFVAGYDSGHGAKPAPGQCLAFARATGLAPAQVAMVGDSRHDLAAGRAAGMRTVAVLTGPARDDDLRPFADVVLPDIGHLPDWLAS